MRLCGAGVSPWMQTNPSTYKVLPQLAHRVVLGGGVPLVGRSKIYAAHVTGIYSQGVYFEPKAGSELRIFGVCNNKQPKASWNPWCVESVQRLFFCSRAFYSGYFFFGFAATHLAQGVQ